MAHDASEDNTLMAENSKIAWTDHTFNPWIGCTEVSPACDHCYARVMMQDRYHKVTWGDHPRLRTSENNWRGPLRWNREAMSTRIRPRVFCASLADVFDNQVDPIWRYDLFGLIDSTPLLDWQLLTKRPQNIAKMLPAEKCLFGEPWPNVWLGMTAENQEETDRRIGHLLSVPASVHFLSCEPMLGPIVIPLGVEWVICGGESGKSRRPFNADWARSLRDQCSAMGVPFFMKQMSGASQQSMDPIPADLMIRQFPLGASEDNS